MKKSSLLLALLAILCTSPLFGQGTALTALPVVVNQSGAPTPGALVTVCVTNPGTGTCFSPATLYTDNTLAYACTGVRVNLNNFSAPTVTSGCSNPGYPDALANVVAFAAAGIYWCQYSGPSIVTYTQPCATPGSGGGGGVSGSGTAGYIPGWTGPTSLGNSPMQYDNTSGTAPAVSLYPGEFQQQITYTDSLNCFFAGCDGGEFTVAYIGSAGLPYLIGLAAQATYASGSGGVVSQLTGATVGATSGNGTGTGSVTNQTGLSVTSANNGGVTVGTNKGIDLGSSTGSGAHITNDYGIFVEPLSYPDTITNHSGIYIGDQGAANYANSTWFGLNIQPQSVGPGYTKPTVAMNLGGVYHYSGSGAPSFNCGSGSTPSVYWNYAATTTGTLGYGCISGSTWTTLFGGGGGGGTVTSVSPATGGGLTTTPNPINGSGTVGLITSCSTNQVLQWNGSAWACATVSGGGMVYPGAGIPNSTGSAWGTSFTPYGALSGIATSADPGTTANVPMVSNGAHGVIPSSSGALGAAAYLTLASGSNINFTGTAPNLVINSTATNGPIFLPENYSNSVQSAINAAIAFGGGTVLLCTNGPTNYTTSTPITLNGANNVTIAGAYQEASNAYPSCTITNSSATADTMDAIATTRCGTGKTSGTLIGMTLRDFSLLRSATPSGTSVGLNLQNVCTALVERVQSFDSCDDFYSTNNNGIFWWLTQAVGTKSHGTCPNGNHGYNVQGAQNTSWMYSPETYTTYLDTGMLLNNTTDLTVYTANTNSGSSEVVITGNPWDLTFLNPVSTGGSWTINMGLSGLCEICQVDITQPYIPYNSGGIGFNIINSQGVNIRGGQVGIGGGGYYGVKITGSNSSRILVDGVSFIQQATGSTGVDAVGCGPGVSDIRVTNNLVSGSTSSLALGDAFYSDCANATWSGNVVTGYGTAGILLDTGASNNVVEANDFSTAHGMTPVIDNGTGDSIYGNVGVANTFALGVTLPSVTIPSAPSGSYVKADGTGYGTPSGGAVSSVSNTDGTLNISPTTGAVIAALNLGNANTWTALQTFAAGIVAGTSGAGVDAFYYGTPSLTGLTTNYVGWVGPSSAPGSSVFYQMPSSAPSGGQVMVFGTPSSNISANSWLTPAPLNSPTFTGTVTIPSGASISGYAPLASPTFTGTPAAPTPGSNISTTQIATTAWTNNYFETITGAQAAFAGIGACSGNTFNKGANANAAPTCTQPAFSNLSGSATVAQLPTPTTTDMVVAPASGTFTNGDSVVGDANGGVKDSGSPNFTSQIFTWGSPSVTPSGTQYIEYGTRATLNSSFSTLISMGVPRAITVTSISAWQAAAETSTNTIQFNVAYCAPSAGTCTPTILTGCTITSSGNAYYCTASLTPTTVAAGDYLAIQTVQTGTGTAGAINVSVTAY